MRTVKECGEENGVAANIDLESIGGPVADGLNVVGRNASFC